jgi:hypothetical protein
MPESIGQQVLRDHPLFVQTEIQNYVCVRMQYRTLDGVEHQDYPHESWCQEAERLATVPDGAVVTCGCHQPMWAGHRDTVFVEQAAGSETA